MNPLPGKRLLGPLLIVAVVPSWALCQESLDVKAGFFSKEEISKPILNNELGEVDSASGVGKDSFAVPPPPKRAQEPAPVEVVEPAPSSPVPERGLENDFRAEEPALREVLNTSRELSKALGVSPSDSNALEGGHPNDTQRTLDKLDQMLKTPGKQGRSSNDSHRF